MRFPLLLYALWHCSGVPCRSMMTETHDTISPTLSCWSPLRGSALSADELLISDGYRLVRCSRVEMRQWSAFAFLCLILIHLDPFRFTRASALTLTVLTSWGPLRLVFTQVVGRVIFEPFVFAPQPAHPWSIDLLLLDNLAFARLFIPFLLWRRGVRRSCWGE